MAVTTRSGPLTASPPAKTPGLEVAPVSGSVTIKPHLCVSRSLVNSLIRSTPVAQGQDNYIGGDGEVRALNRYRAAATAVVGFAQFALQAFDCTHAPVDAGNKAHRLGEETVLGSLFHAPAGDLSSAWHLRFRPAVKASDFFSPSRSTLRRRSEAVSPPPTTATHLPNSSLLRLSWGATWDRHWSGSGSQSPGKPPEDRPRGRPSWRQFRSQPLRRRRRSPSFRRLSMVSFSPIRVLVTNFVPADFRSSITALTVSLGSLKFGIP